MTKTQEELIKESKEEIPKYQKMIELTKEIIEINNNPNRYNQNNFLSDFNEELENHIKTYEESIKNRLLIIYKKEGLK